MSDRFRTAFRGYLVDHHSPAPPVVTLERLDVEEYRRFYRTARISSLMLYCKDHWGYSWYDTRLGVRHPALEADWVAAVARVLQEEDIEFNAYYCLEYDTLAPRMHPEWSLLDAAGQPVVLRGRKARWGMPCYETGYRGLVLGQLSEIVERYRPDSLFLDIFGKSLCYCPCCRAAFRDRFGYPLPLPVEAPREERQALDFGEAGRDVNRFLEDCADRMLDDILHTVRALDPDLRVTLNFAALYPDRIRNKLDYQFTEPWAGNRLSAAYSRDTDRSRHPQLGPGDVSEVYNYRHPNVYVQAAAQIAAQGCRVFFYSGSQHVDGTLEHEEARRIGEAYRQVAAMEPWLAGRSVLADVAILQSDRSSRARAGNLVIANAIGRCKRPDPHREAVLGAMAACDAAQVTWAVLPEEDATPETLSRYSLVLLAGVHHVSPELADGLRAHVHGGGALLADGACGCLREDGTPVGDSALSDLLGCRLLGVLDTDSSAEWGSYVERVDGPVWRQAPDTFLPTGPRQVEAEPRGAAVLGWLRPPAVALTDTTWVNWWDPPPAARSSSRPAILEYTPGKGRVLYLAYDFFEGSARGLHLNQALFNGMLEHLLPDPTLRLLAPFPDSVGFTAYRRGPELIVHNNSRLPERTGGDAPPIPGGTLRIRTDRLPVASAALVLPEARPLSIRRHGHWADIELPNLSIHQLLVARLAKSP